MSWYGSLVRHADSPITLSRQERDPSSSMPLHRRAGRGRDVPHADPAPNDTLNDALVVQIRAADEALARAAFETLYRTYVDGLIVFAAGYAGSRAVAQDLVADLFVSLWERRAEWMPTHGVRAYLYGAIRRRALNATRDASRRAHLMAASFDASDIVGMGSGPESIEDVLDVEQQVAHVIRAIASFPEPRRRILELRWRDGLGAAEIAHVLNMTRNAVDIHLTRALRLLRQMLPDRIG